MGLDRRLEPEPVSAGAQVDRSRSVECAERREAAREDDAPLVDAAPGGERGHAVREVAVDLDGGGAALADAGEAGGASQAVSKFVRAQQRAWAGGSTHPQTIRDCPRRASPAAKTPSTDVSYFCKAAKAAAQERQRAQRGLKGGGLGRRGRTLSGVLMLLRPSTSMSSALMSSCSGPRKPSARKHRSAGKNFSDPICKREMGSVRGSGARRAAAD